MNLHRKGSEGERGGFGIWKRKILISTCGCHDVSRVFICFVMEG